MREYRHARRQGYGSPVIDTPPPPPRRPPGRSSGPRAYQVSYGARPGARGARATRASSSRVDGRDRAGELRLGAARRSRLDVALPRRDVSGPGRDRSIARGRRAGRTVSTTSSACRARRARGSGRRASTPGSRRTSAGWRAAFPGPAAVYVENLATGAGAAWNARATFPAASTLKLAIAVTLLARLERPPAAGSPLDRLLPGDADPVRQRGGEPMLVAARRLDERRRERSSTP